MKWFLGAIGLLTLALVFRLGLLAYAMYVLLGTMLLSRFLAWAWSEKLSAARECNRLTAAVGETVAVVVTEDEAAVGAGIRTIRTGGAHTTDSTPVSAIGDAPNPLTRVPYSLI